MTFNKIKFDIDKILYYLTFAYAFFIPISRAGIGVFSILLILLWFFKPTFKEDIKYLKSNKFIIIFMLFILYSLLSSLWSDDTLYAIKYVKKYWYYLPMFVIATTLKREQISSIFSAFLMGMLISEVISYGIFFEWWTWKNCIPLNPTPFMNHIQYSYFLVFAAFVLLYEALSHEEGKKRFIYGLFFITMTSNIFINAGRISYITFIVGLVLFFFLRVKSKVIAGLTATMVLLVVFVTAYSVSPIFKLRLQNTTDEMTMMAKGDYEKSSIAIRLALYYVAGHIVADHPVVGVGTGGAKRIMNTYTTQALDKFSYLQIQDHFHNIFIENTVQLGFLGLVVMLLLFYYAFTIKVHDRKILSIKYIFLTIFILIGMTSNGFHLQFPMALFALVMGIVLAQNRIEQEA